MKCINEDINQVEVGEPNVMLLTRCMKISYGNKLYHMVYKLKSRKGEIMKRFPNAVCALFDYLYLVIELGS